MYLFYDLKTFGPDPAFDRISEFSAVRTDDDVRPVSDAVHLGCGPSADYLPDPATCLATGIVPRFAHDQTPEQAPHRMIEEPDLAGEIHGQFCSDEPATIVGYDTLHTNDQFVRHLFYRTFYEPYLWERCRSNSRIDLYPVMPALFDFFRDSLTWTYLDNGTPSFALPDIVAANHLEDSVAVHGVSALIFDRVPQVWSWLPTFGDRKGLASLCLTASHAGETADRILVYSSASLTTPQRSSTYVLPLFPDPRNARSNQWWMLDLSPTGETAPDATLFQRSEDELAERMTGTGESRLIVVDLNRFPILFPVTLTSSEKLESGGCRYSDALDQARQVLESDFVANLEAGLRRVRFDSKPKSDDVDGHLYAAFPTRADRSGREMIRSQSLQWLRYQHPDSESVAFPRFHDPRYVELLWRYRARYLPETLSAEEERAWKTEVRTRLTDPPSPRIRGFAAFDQSWQQIAATHRANPILGDLLEYRNTVARRLGVDMRSF